MLTPYCGKSEDKSEMSLSQLLDEITLQTDRAVRGEGRVNQLESMIIKAHAKVFDKPATATPSRF